MVTRELLSSQSILSSFSAKTMGATSTQSSDQSFKAVLQGKQVVENNKGFSVRSESVNSKTSNDLRATKNETAKTAENVTQEKNASNEKADDVNTNESAEKLSSDSSTAKPSNEDSEALKALKEKLEEAGLSEDEISLIMAMMGPNLQEIVQNMDFETLKTLDVTDLVKVVQLLDNMEVNQKLDLDLDETLVQNLKDTLNNFETTLENAIKSSGGDSEKLESLLNAMKGHVESLVNEVSTETEVPVKSVVLSMQNGQEKATIKTSDHIEASTQVDDKTLAKDVQTVSTDTSTETETSDDSGDEVIFESVKSTEKASAKNEDKAETISIEADVEQPSVNTAQTQEQRIMEALLKNTEVRQVPKQEIFTQVMDAIKANLSVTETGSSMMIKLQPEQLGDVEVKVTINKGVVLAEIKVENETVKAAIETNLDQLKQSLTQKGYNSNSISVSVESGKKEDEQKQFENQTQKNKKIIVESDEEDFLDKMTSRYGQDGLYDTSTIDYFG